MKHQWQMIEKVSQILHRDICIKCGLERNSKNKDDGKGFITTYVGGLTAYAHTPECYGKLKIHNWRFDPKLPWMICDSCGSNRLITVVPVTLPGNMVWFQKDNGDWSNEYHPCY
ncbi:hypothetical protein KAR91_22920 [Candidatus Pacearchaeota archaeon]|nr:hypothetical protein [Candidatus Pacearchaeota archaeon]